MFKEVDINTFDLKIFNKLWYTGSTLKMNYIF